MKSNLLKIAGILLTSTPIYASECQQYNTPPKITTTINYSIPTYTSIAKEQITSITGLQNPLQTMGLTIADFQIQFSLLVDKNPSPNGICVNINSIDFDIGYNSINVLIDDKYKPLSCQYEEIKKHEQEHVKIYQNELKYYGKLIVEEIKILLENTPSFLMPVNTTELQITKKIDKILKGDDKLNILKSRLEQAITTKNSAHDSEEEYLRVKNSCSDW